VIPVSDQPRDEPFQKLREESDEPDPEAAAELAQLAAKAAEAGLLDPPKLASFALVVLDDVGAPVPGVDVTLQLPDGPQTLPTDDSGGVRLDNVFGPVTAAFEDMPQLRKVLRPRFLAPREPKAFDETNALVKPLSELVDPIKLTPDVPITLLLTPSIECHEIPGANFDFGRSFVRSTAIEQLADIAEALRNTVDVQAMIFGHTDLSGSEALNKELSERRARAVHALLTHDSIAWEQLFSGTADGANWQEKWDLEETQNMLNALGCSDDSGAPLTENGKRDEPTKQAIRRFQRADYPDRPAEQQPVPESDFLGKDGRRLLFLAYAKRVSRQPIAPDRFLDINGARFMGCGEFNALSLSAKDQASRRVNVFLFDPVAAPDKLPCKLRQLGPCRPNLDPKPTALDENGKAPFRCRIFQGIASKCTAAPSPDLDHDLVLRFPLQLTNANQLAHKYTLEADDGTITFERTLADDARANDDTLVELSFEHLPEQHKYRLTCDDGEQPPYTVFDFFTLKELQDHFRDDLVALDLALPPQFLQDVTAPVLVADGDLPPDDDAEADVGPEDEASA
jgi:outer membrane protein OmpA-like peptidoglycan-associated protein